MNQSKTLNENLDEFKKLTNDFNQSGEKLGIESEAAILINSLHDATLKYGRESISVDAVITALKNKELELQLEGKNGGVLSPFSLRGRISSRRILLIKTTKTTEIDPYWNVSSVTKKDISRKTVQKEEDTIEEMIVENLSHMEEKSQLGT